LTILHKLRNVVNVVWKREIMSWFTKLSFINDMKKDKLKNWKKRVINS
jgi:hypothetical protein